MEARLTGCAHIAVAVAARCTIRGTPTELVHEVVVKVLHIYPVPNIFSSVQEAEIASRTIARGGLHARTLRYHVAAFERLDVAEVPCWGQMRGRLPGGEVTTGIGRIWAQPPAINAAVFSHRSIAHLPWNARTGC
jgi:hypothetical protein